MKPSATLSEDRNAALPSRNGRPEIDQPDEEALPLIAVDRSKAFSGAGAKVSRLRRAFRTLRFVPLLMLILAVGGFVGLYVQPPGLQKLMAILDLEPGAGTSTPIAVPVNRAERNAASAGATGPSTSAVVGLGTLLPRGNIVTVALPFGAGDARIGSVRVEEGDRVARGDVLVVLDSEPTLQAAVRLAETSLAAQQASLAQVRADVAASGDESRAALARVEAAVVSTRRDFERAETLSEKGYVTAATLDAKRVAYQQAVQDAEQARASLARFAYENLDNQPQVVVAARSVDQARAELARAKAELDRAYVRAPTDGTVLTIHVRPGERPGEEGIFNLGNLEEMFVEVEIYQTLIGSVEVGAPVTVSAAALPEPLEGRVTRIGLEVGQQTLTAADPAANTDARVVEVEVKLDPQSSEIARRYSNLQVTARIDAGAER